MSRIRNGVLGTFGALAISASFGCAAKTDLGGESHFLCSRDAQCPTSAPICDKGECRVPQIAHATPAIRDAGVDSAQSKNIADAHASGTRLPPPDANACVPLDYSPEFSETDCHQLDSLVLENPRLSASNGSTVISPGDAIALHVDWRETKGFTSAHFYPGVYFFLENDAGTTQIGMDFRYAAGPCATDTFSTEFTVPASALPGATYVVIAQISLLHNFPGFDAGLCSPISLAIPITVGARLPQP